MHTSRFPDHLRTIFCPEYRVFFLLLAGVLNAFIMILISITIFSIHGKYGVSRSDRSDEGTESTRARF